MNIVKLQFADEYDATIAAKKLDELNHEHVQLSSAIVTESDASSRNTLINVIHEECGYYSSDISLYDKAIYIKQKRGGA